LEALEKCGLIPLNHAMVIKRIPSIIKTAEIMYNVDQVLLKKLEVQRFGDRQKKRPREKKILSGVQQAR
jgi:hypothetical protein